MDSDLQDKEKRKKLIEEEIDERLENIVVEQSVEILKLEQELALYKHLYGPLTEESLERGEHLSEKVSKADPRMTQSQQISLPVPTKSPELKPIEEEPITVKAEQESVPGRPSELTLQLSENHILPHIYEAPKKSSVLFGAPKLLTVHNYTKSTIYGTIYDRVRMGVSRKHTRVTPVFRIDEKPVIFEKPYLRGSRSIHFLFCKEISLFDEHSTEMSDLCFRSFPQISVDFSSDIVIDIDDEGSLIAMTKVQWEKETIRKQMEKKKIQPSPDKASTPSVIPEQLVYVRFSKELCAEEKYFLKKRRSYTLAGLESFVGMSLEDQYVPRIAFCGSGGGCRAMVSTLGFLIGMETIGLLDCLTYIAGVSGSTWTLALWIALGIPPSELRKNISTKFAQNLITRPNSKGAAELVTLLRQKWTPGNRSISLVDIYGAQLAAGLLHDTKPQGCEYKLSNQASAVDKGEMPLPIYTAVQRQVDGYHSWFEFTPYEVGSRDYGAFVPTHGFGRAYRKGQSIDTNSEPSLGLLLGTFGSAFCAPLQRMAEELFDTPDREESLASEGDEGFLKKTVMEYKETVENMIDNLSLQHTSVLAASKFNNFAYDPTVEASCMRHPTLELYDAGVDGNLPFPVLLREEREIDLIIACNSSKYPDINRGRALREAKEWAERNHVKFPPVDYSTSYATHVSVYKDPEDPTCPVVIYLPLKHNPLYSSFDPQEVQLAGGYCSTFNFNMTREQVNELSGLSEFNMTISSPVIKETIKQIIELKTKLYSTS